VIEKKHLATKAISSQKRFSLCSEASSLLTSIKKNKKKNKQTNKKTLSFFPGLLTTTALALALADTLFWLKVAGLPSSGFGKARH